MRGEASISVILMSFSGSILSRPNGRGRARFECSSADNSVPVAPAPTMATCNCPARTGPGWALARTHGVQQTAVEALGLLRRIEHDGVLVNARRAERIRYAADRNHQRVIGSQRSGVIWRPSSSTVSARWTRLWKRSRPIISP